MIGIDEDKPDFINEDGVKWWHDKSTTHYARQKKVMDVQAWTVHHPERGWKRVLVQDQQVIWEGASLEDIGVEIDKIFLIRKHCK